MSGNTDASSTTINDGSLDATARLLRGINSRDVTSSRGALSDGGDVAYCKWYDWTCTRSYETIRFAIIDVGCRPPPVTMRSCMECAVCVNASSEEDEVASARFFIDVIDEVSGRRRSSGSSSSSSSDVDWSTSVCRQSAHSMYEAARQMKRESESDSNLTRLANDFERLVNEWAARYQIDAVKQPQEEDATTSSSSTAAATSTSE